MYVRFQCVNNLQIFFGENNGSENTVISKIEVYGTTV
jgi:hypothetical protein